MPKRHVKAIVVEVLRDYCAMEGHMVQYIRSMHGNLATVLKKDTIFRLAITNARNQYPLMGIQGSPEQELCEYDKCCRPNNQKSFLYNKNGQAVLQRRSKPLKTDFPDKSPANYLQKLIDKKRQLGLKTPKFFAEDSKENLIDIMSCDDANQINL